MIPKFLLTHWQWIIISFADELYWGDLKETKYKILEEFTISL